MGITYGDHLIDSGYYDITPEQEREIEERRETEMTDKHRLPDGRTKLLAHDVRHLRACDACGGIGDNRTMIRCMIWGVEDMYHTECAVEKLGDYILKLPIEELNKFTLAATGADLMKAILRTTERFVPVSSAKGSGND